MLVATVMGVTVFENSLATYTVSPLGVMAAL